MNKLMSTVALLALTTSGAIAGGIERVAPSTGILFEDGEYAEFSISSVSPTISGSIGGGAVPSGDMAQAYQNWSFGYKRDLSDQLALAVTVNQPYGASVAYPSAAAPYPFNGATAELSTLAVNGMLRYRMPNNVSVFGGIRLQSMKGDISLPTGGGPYALNVPAEWDVGYALGVAYERPDIALRVALSYNSEITHGFSDNTGNPFDVVTPQSVNLEFQSGIAQNTLLFGSIHWVDWATTDITPPEYPGGALVDYTESTTTYNLGIGRKFNETWSGAVMVGYEPSGGTPTGNLGPTDGNTSIGLAATWTQDNVKITGGIRYIDIGDATTSTINASFTDNHAVAAGIKMSVNF
ncbi:OmpP1/FadL family transporter [Halocynthiibacter sp.]|uniref:OmpP1/FadL family transporter n=1 Tax=Halocynthiibacter sp. TaxID=1979210 RepID=UPI003C55D424